MGHSEATATHTLASPADSHKQQSELTNWQALMQAGVFYLLQPSFFKETR